MKDQWIEWLQDNPKNFIYGVISVVAIFFISFQLFGKFHKPSIHKYTAANEVFEKWLQQDEAFEKLEETLKAYPELATKFGVLIADKLIVQNQGEKAESFADNVFKRVLKQTPEHTAFAEGSLLIAKDKLNEALTQALSLKSRLKEDSLLYGFNLLRISSLYQALNSKEQEKTALEDLSAFLKNNENISTILNDCFKEGDKTLLNYIEQRKLILK